jgi:hypothetical protein
MYPFRIFISYAHADKKAVEDIDTILRGEGLTPVWDKEVKPGTLFTDSIKRQIATAHLFMPLLTQSSQTRPWVHQEIGFAIGIDVPVLPIALHQLPGEMVAAIQAVSVKEDLSDLADSLRRADIEALILRHVSESELQRLGISNRVADYSEERTSLLVTYAEGIREPAYVRQRALFSSFSIPDAFPGDRAWDVIELVSRRSEFHRSLLRRERRALVKHARASGCSLIICPFVEPTGPGGAAAHKAQREELLAFLGSMSDDKLTVAIAERGIEGHLNLLGDWVGAKALPPLPGADYRQTSFTQHAPTVLSWLRDFDHELEGILGAAGITADQSRRFAMARIEASLRSLAP